MSLKRDLQISIRQLWAEKINSVINIAGLIMGLGVAAVIIIFLLNETGYNSSFVNGNRIYRVLNQNEVDNNVWANTPFVLGETLKKNYPGIEDCAHQYNIYDFEIKNGDEFVNETSMLCTDESFFRMFSIRVVEGTTSDFDDAGDKVLISRSFAQKYFKDTSPVGKAITLRAASEESILVVSGVFEDIPDNSTIKASVIANSEFGLRHLVRVVISNSSMKLNEVDFKNSWNYGQFFTNYILLKEGASVGYLSEMIRQLGEEHSEETNRLSFSLQALSDVYFGSGKMTDNNTGDRGNKPMVLILAFTGMLILVVACVNYINLTSAQALALSKALAIRKVCGASRADLIRQQVTGSVLISLIALPFALMLIEPLLPFISNMLGKTYSMTLSNRLIVSIGAMAAVTIASGALSGFFVALRVTSFNLADTLKGQMSGAGRRMSISKAMIVFQMTVFIILISMVILVNKQVRYVFTKDLGFVKEGLLRIPLGDHDYQLFRQEAEKMPDVVSVSGAMWMPPHNNHMTISMPRVDDPAQMVAVHGLFVDYNFATTMGIRVVMGDDFDKAKAGSGVLVNELAAKALGLKSIIGENTPFGQVVGVVADFNMYSLHEKVAPLIIGLNTSMCRDIAVRIRTDNIPATISSLKELWASSGGNSPFTYEFTDDRLKEMYDSDMRFAVTTGFLAGIAVLIASLGLFGLSLLTSRRRTKEIGIRKVSGASMAEVIMLVNRDYIICLLIAFVVAVPLSILGMQHWLAGFAFRTEISWWIFALSGMAALLIAVISVSVQSYRAATQNPVEALRYE